MNVRIRVFVRVLLALVSVSGFQSRLELKYIYNMPLPLRRTHEMNTYPNERIVRNVDSQIAAAFLENDLSEHPLLLITIGPQCAGKTTVVRERWPNAVEIAMDNMRQTYKIVKKKYVLEVFSDYKNIIEASGNSERIDRYDANIFQQLRGTEQHLLLLLFENQISISQFSMEISKLLTSEYLRDELLNVVCRIIQDNYSMSTTFIDLFDGKGLKKSVNEAKQALKTSMMSIETTQVAWANTNLHPSYYSEALGLAETTKRRVKFVTWDSLDLPRVSFSELIRRNVIRYLQTGRYIPTSTIFEFMSRADELVEHARLCSPELDNGFGYALLAGYKLDPEGYVHKSS